MSTDAPDAAPSDLAPGRRLGPWRLEGELGRGGMGVVYRARRADDVGRPVAVKVLGSWIDDASARRLFEDERRILARLDHPHIARLLDAGTTADGRPYFVMDYVDGRPLLAWADERGLDVEARLRLFIDVCAAVHYAHQNLVVHRDLKPGNILVTAEGVPRLLDFGIARLLEREGGAEAATLTLLRPLTPEYASPEQLRGRPVTTASDVYSLGALLYELLTGLPAHGLRSRAPEELVRVVCEEDALAPSLAVRRGGSTAVRPDAATATQPGREAAPRTTRPLRPAAPRPGDPRLSRRLRGDLDTIVLKALQKDPARRYVSVDELAADLRRHLDGYPVTARPDTLAYRLRSLARRHRAPVAVGLLLLASLLLGGAAAGWQWRAARLERQRAERGIEELRALARSALYELHDAIQDLPGATPVRALLVQHALTYLDALRRDTGDDPTLLAELAAAYRRVGDVQGRPTEANLGDRPGALASYRTAVAIHEQLVARQPADAPARRDLGAALTRLATLLTQERDGDAEAVALIERAVALFDALLRAAPGDPDVQRQALVAVSKLGDLQGRQQRLDAAYASYTRFMALARELAVRPDATVQDQRTLMVAHYKAYRVLMRRGRHADAVRVARGTVEMTRARLAADPTSASGSRDLAVVLNALGDGLQRLGQVRDALETYRESLAIRRGLRAVDPRNALADEDLVGSLVRIGDALARLGDRRAARAAYDEVRPVLQALLRRDASDATARAELLALDVRLAELEGPARSAVALAVYERAWPSFDAPAGAPPDARHDQAVVLTGLARAQAALALHAATGVARRASACAQAARARGLWRGLEAVVIDSPALPVLPLEARLAPLDALLRACPSGPRAAGR